MMDMFTVFDVCFLKTSLCFSSAARSKPAVIARVSRWQGYSQPPVALRWLSWGWVTQQLLAVLSFVSCSGEWQAAERTVLWRSFPALGRKAVISTELIDALMIVWIQVRGWHLARRTDLLGVKGKQSQVSTSQPYVLCGGVVAVDLCEPWQGQRMQIQLQRVIRFPSHWAKLDVRFGINLCASGFLLQM